MTAIARERELAGRYFADARDRDVEASRLERLAGFYDPPTCAWLLDAGALRPAGHVLEFGFGCGSMLRWFARQTGPAGRVLGLDLDISHAPEMPVPVAVAAGDIYAATGGDTDFDLVFARLLLEHLDRPAEALAGMVARTRSGGMVAVADLDCGVVRATDPSGPDAAAFDRDVEAVRSGIARTGLMDPSFGCALAGLFKSAGLTDVRERRFDRVVAGGSPWAVFQAENNRIIGAQVGEAEAAERIARRMETPGFTYHDQALVCVTGTRPA